MELLVVVAIMTIVSTAAVAVFRSAAQNEQSQQQNLDHVQNLRAAFHAVSRDIRMAGNGLGLLGTNVVQIYIDSALIDEDIQTNEGWFKYKNASSYGARAIYGFNSGTDMSKADSVVIFRSDVEDVKAIGQLSQEFKPTDGSLHLEAAVTRSDDLVDGHIADGDIIALTTGTVALILQANIDSASSTELKIGDRFKPGAALADPSGYNFPAGTSVYNLKDVSFVTYYLDTDNNRLMANYHDVMPASGGGTAPRIVTVADFIEDFQLSYNLAPTKADSASELAWQADIDENTLRDGTEWVRAVQLGMVSRSDKRRGGGDPVELMGHKASNESGFSRRILVDTIRLRNASD